MSLKEQISNALKNAMKQNDTETRRALRSVMSAIKNLEVDRRAELNDEDILGVLHKEIKVRNEFIEGAQKTNRQDLIDEGMVDIKIISQFLPAGLSDDELRELTRSAIQELGANGPADMGKVMKELLPKVAGKAPNSKVSQIVRELLQG